MSSAYIYEKAFKSARGLRAFNASSRSRTGAYLFVLGGGLAAGYYAHENGKRDQKNGNSGSGGNGSWKPLVAGTAIINTASVPKSKGLKDYQEVYNDIAEKVHEEEDADDGAGRYGLLTRLAWHNSGTYKKADNTGGSFGGTMIYKPEETDGENAGLSIGREFLSEFMQKYPWLSRGDLWTLGGVVAVQECGGPKIKWRPGRQDIDEQQRVPENGRLPQASRGADHVRDVFSRMGLTDQETVALIGAHCLGKCHTDRSGYDGPWGPSFNMFTNDFFVRLLQNWHIRKWDGKKQYEDDETNSFMMLPTDMALKEDGNFIKYVKQYAEDQDLFFKDFANAFSKLLELGITFPKDSKPLVFKTLEEQEDD